MRTNDRRLRSVPYRKQVFQHDPVDMTSRGTYGAFNIFVEGAKKYHVTIGLHANVDVDEYVKVAWVVRSQIWVNNGPMRVDYMNGFIVTDLGLEPHDVIAGIIDGTYDIVDHDSFKIVDSWT